ncbi:hypothetical protein K1719_032721 [Acacia pycnantha]|nr:hypothetical protein K1719_032721 [Acacia pycnantha]
MKGPDFNSRKGELNLIFTQGPLSYEKELTWTRARNKYSYNLGNWSWSYMFLKTTKMLVKIWLRNFRTRWSKTTYDIGSTIRDKIIPHALSWFTGEAIQGEEFGDLEGCGR